MSSIETNAYLQASLREKESELNQKIGSLDRQKHAAVAEHEQDLEKLKDRYERSNNYEHEKHAQARDTIRDQGSQNLEEIRAATKRAVRELNARGEREIRNERDMSESELYKIGRNNLTQKRELKQRLQSDQQHLELESKTNLLWQQAQARQTLEALQRHQEKKQVELERAHEEELSRIQAQQDSKSKNTALLQSEALERVFETQHDALGDIQGRMNQKITELKNQYATQASDYETQLQDPFYQLRKLEPEISETDDYYILTMDIPESEHDHVSININDRGVSIQSRRDIQDTQIGGSGEKFSTTRYETSSVVLPPLRHVNAKAVERRTEGSMVQWLIPKDGAKNYALYQHPEQKQAMQGGFPHQKIALKSPPQIKSKNRPIS